MALILTDTAKKASDIGTSPTPLDSPRPHSSPNSGATKSEQYDLASFDDSGYVPDAYTRDPARLEAPTPPENVIQVSAPTASVTTLREVIRPLFDMSCFRIRPGGTQLCLVRGPYRKRAAIERDDTQDFPNFMRLDPFLRAEVVKWYLESINPKLEGDWSNTFTFLSDREIPHIFRINTALRDEAYRIGSKLEHQAKDLDCDREVYRPWWHTLEILCVTRWEHVDEGLLQSGMPNLHKIILNWHYLSKKQTASSYRRVSEWGVRTPVQHIHRDYIDTCITDQDIKTLFLSTDVTNPFHKHARYFWDHFARRFSSLPGERRQNLTIQVQGTVLARCGILDVLIDLSSIPTGDPDLANLPLEKFNLIKSPKAAIDSPYSYYTPNRKWHAVRYCITEHDVVQYLCLTSVETCAMDARYALERKLEFKQRIQRHLFELPCGISEISYRAFGRWAKVGNHVMLRQSFDYLGRSTEDMFATQGNITNYEPREEEDEEDSDDGSDNYRNSWNHEEEQESFADWEDTKPWAAGPGTVYDADEEGERVLHPGFGKAGRRVTWICRFERAWESWDKFQDDHAKPI